MQDDGIIDVRDGNIRRITIHRPTSANALNLETATALRDSLHSAAAEGAAVLVLSGGERFFSAGGDLRAMVESGNPQEYVRRLAETLHDGLSVIAESKTIFVAAVRGTAAGAGLGLVLNADVSLCSQSSRFRAAYGAAGLTPDMGLSALLPRAIGEVRAGRLLLLNEQVDAETAFAWGMVSGVVRDSEFDGHVAGVVAALVSMPAVNATKKLLFDGRGRTLAEQMGAEADLISTMVTTPDAQHRIANFLSGTK